MNAARAGSAWLHLAAVAASFAWGGALLGVFAAFRLELAGCAKNSFGLMGYCALAFLFLGVFLWLLQASVRRTMRLFARRPAVEPPPFATALAAGLGGFLLCLAVLLAVGDTVLVLAFRRDLSRVLLLFRVALYLLAGGALAWVCCRPLAAVAKGIGRRLRGVAAAGALVGLAGLPPLVALLGAIRADTVVPRSVDLRLSRTDTGLGVLLVGLDGGTWRVLDPLMAAGALPNLARLCREGATARIDSPPPQVSPALWATVVTGTPPEVHGIHDYLVVRLPGVAEFSFDSLAKDRALIPFSLVLVGWFAAGVAEGIPPTADRLAVPALWDYLDAGGAAVLLLGWPGTWPARRIRGLVLSDRFGPNEWDLFSSRRGPPPEVLWPPQEEEVLRRRARDSRGDIGAALQGLLSFEPAQLESLRALVMNPLLPEPARMLADVLDADRTFLDILADRFPDGGFALAAVMLNAADLALHAFWPQRFPADFGLGQAAHPERGAIIDAVLGDLDRGIGDVLARSGPNTVVVIVSDHGMKPDPGNPVWPGWHDREAMLLLAGGPVRPGPRRDGVTHLDIAPTILYLLGFAVPERMSGRVLSEMLEPAFVAAHPERRQASGE